MCVAHMEETVTLADVYRRMKVASVGMLRFSVRHINCLLCFGEAIIGFCYVSDGCIRIRLCIYLEKYE